MKVPFVDLSKQYLSIKADIDNAIQRVINETSFIGGTHVREFEANFSQLYGVKNCVSVANGTDSLYIILKMLGIGNGDEVITSAYSWISSSESISQAGAKPVFVDIDEFFSLDVTKLEASITPKTKAIMPVHIHGQMCDMDAIVELANKYRLHIIEDCAQSHFSEYKGKRAGLFGIAGSFSFYPGKNLGAYGDAGCIITNDDDFANKCRMFANHGALIKHNHLIEGINSRLDGIQAAILNAKLPYIIKWTSERINAANLYNSMLAGNSFIKLPKVRPDTMHSFHLYVILTSDRDNLKKHLSSHGIETAIHYPTALPFLPCYENRGYSADAFSASHYNQMELLSLPIYPDITTEQIEYVSSVINNYFSAK